MPIKVIWPPSGQDADEYLRNGTWQALLAMAKTMKPSWDGFREKIKDTLLLSPNEGIKDRATKKILEALERKGRMVRTTTGDLLYIEE